MQTISCEKFVSLLKFHIRIGIYQMMLVNIFWIYLNHCYNMNFTELLHWTSSRGSYNFCLQGWSQLTCKLKGGHFLTRHCSAMVVSMLWCLSSVQDIVIDVWYLHKMLESRMENSHGSGYIMPESTNGLNQI